MNKCESPIFLFRRIHEVDVRNSKIIAAFNGDLGAAIVAKKDSPFNYRSELRDTVALEKLFFYQKYRAKIINIIQQGFC